MPGGVETQQSVVHGHLVERRSFLVANERVRDPDASPAVVAESQLGRPADARHEHEPSVAPRLTQVHTHRVILQYIYRPAMSEESTASHVCQ